MSSQSSSSSPAAPQRPQTRRKQVAQPTSTPAAQQPPQQPQQQQQSSPDPPPAVPPSASNGGEGVEPLEAEPSQAEQVGSKRKMTWAQAADESGHPLNKPSRHYVRSIDAYGEMKVVLEMGIWVQHQLNDSKSLADLDLEDEDMVVLDKYDAFAALFQTKDGQKLDASLSYWLKEGGLSPCLSIIQAARVAARAEDAGIAKAQIVLARTWEPTLAGVAKTERGFRHPEIALLLVPPHDAEKIKDPKILEQYTQGQIKLHPDIYPPFMYYKGVIDATNKWRGLLKSDLLVEIGQVCYNGGKGSTRPRKKRSTKSKAWINNMHEMTLPAIAWIATLTLYSLSADDEFTACSEQGINYSTFYERLLATLEAASKARRTELLSWWTKKLFGQGRVTVPLPAGVRTTVEELEGNEDCADDFDLDY